MGADCAGRPLAAADGGRARSTDLHGGRTAGAEQVKAHLAMDGVNRCLLLTDDLANNGLTEPAALAAFAKDLRASGVTTFTFGVGSAPLLRGLGR